MENATIAALATPAGSGGVGIVKISGPRAVEIAGRVFRRSGSRSPIFRSHRLYHGCVVDPDSGKVIDEVLLGVMRAPNTYTREDVVEINAHSGPAVLGMLLETVLRAGARLAEPGEFTRRAFLNGRIDLTQAEAVADMIAAKTERSLESAARQLAGEMRVCVGDIRDRMIQVLAACEAAMDFPEDLDGHNPVDGALRLLDAGVAAPLEVLIRQYADGHVFRDGIEMIIVGRPNVGKSSLMNRLLGQDRVIVADTPGTTRDVIRETLNLEGVPVTLADSAGIQAGSDPLEAMGVARTRSHLAISDRVLMLVDGAAGVTDEDWDIYRQVRHKRPLLAVNKTDLMQRPQDFQPPKSWETAGFVMISALFNTGIESLKKMIVRTVRGSGFPEKASAVIPTLRQKTAFEDSRAATLAAVGSIGAGAFELAAVDLKYGVDRLGEVIGVTVRLDILDEIFSRFCIGK